MSAIEIQKLSESLHEYEAQLDQVKTTLSTLTNDADKETLSSLKNDIEQLITLTKENLSELTDATKNQNSTIVNDNDGIDDPFAKEYALFKAELETAEEEPQRTRSNDEVSKSNEIPDIGAELEALQGMKCQAPFHHSWGTSFHNALVFHVEPADNITEMGQIQVRVMFTNPIENKMIPCSFYLEGDCRFDDSKCRFSHGELVNLSHLKEYKEPNFESIKVGSAVLVLSSGKDKLWHRAKVVHEIKDSVWEVRLETSGGGKVQVGLKDMLPLESAEDCGSESDSLSDDSDETEDEHEGEENLAQQTAMVELSLTKSLSSALGAWEQHTKGIGSRLMEKMGYVTGTGLGPLGEGRVEPVEAVVFPPGKSLDHCMQLKAEAGGDNLLKTEKKLRRLKKKQMEQQKMKYEREKKRVNVFDFLNSKLGDNSVKPSTSKESDVQKALKNESRQSLNLANLQVGEDLKRAQKDLIHLKESLRRQTIGTPAHKAIASKVSGKEKEIMQLQESEKRINAEQNLRQGNKKMAIF